MLLVMTTVKTRRQEYADQTRAAVLQAATTLFAERGYARTSIDDVAVAARVSRGTVYGHFDGKQALFEAALAEQERSVTEHLQALALTYDDPFEGCVAALRAFLDVCRDTTYGHVVMREGPAALPYAQWLRCAEPYSLSTTRALLALLVDAGVVAPVPLETASRMLHGLLASAAVLIAESDADAEAQARVREETEEVLLRIVEGLRLPA